jgi:hypothetical protein
MFAIVYMVGLTGGCGAVGAGLVISVVAAARWGIARLFAVLALVDLTFWTVLNPLPPLWIGSPTVTRTGESLPKWEVIAFAVGISLTAHLWFRWHVPVQLLPVRGEWARKLLAAVALAALAAASPAPLYLVALLGLWVDRLTLGHVAVFCAAAAYCTPLWRMLVRGSILVTPAERYGRSI